MGWNEARITLVPNGWDLVVEEINIQTVSGETARMVSTVKSIDCPADAIHVDTIGCWLLSQRFLENEKQKSGRSYRREDMLVEIYVDGKEVSEIRLEFTLTRESPNRWFAWMQFVADLCEAWPLTLADWEARMKIGPDKLFHLLRREISWQDFERSFNWPAPKSDNCF